MRTLRTTAGTGLIVVIWIGLATGLLDLALMILKTHLTGERFYRVGEHFAWIIPLGALALVGLMGAVLAALIRVFRGRLFLSTAVGLFAFFGFLECSARLPLEFWAALLLSGGLAVQSARFVGAHQEAFLRLMRRTLPLMAGTVGALMLFMLGRHSWLEYRALSTLPPPVSNARNVLLIVWDTVRTANLSLYGYGRRTSPNLERLATQGVHFQQAFATAPWTLPSHSSFFTGRWPHDLSADWRASLDAAHPTLAEFLSAQGYDTAGFVANLDFCGRETGLSRGFAHYEDYPIELGDIFLRYIGIGTRADLLTPASVLNRLLKKYWGDQYDVIPRPREHVKSAETINRSFLSWLSWQRSRARPFFAFLNYNDAHSPYDVPDAKAPAFGLRPVSYLDRLVLRSWDTIDKTQLAGVHVQMANDVYDDSIWFLDARLGDLLGELKTRGVLDDTLIVVASDHGEHLGDHLLFFHGCSLYRQLVGVPLLIVDPTQVPAGRDVAEPVSLRDIPSTIVDLLRLPGPAPFGGRSLARFWAPDSTGEAKRTEPLLMETEKPPHLTNQGREPVAKGPMKGLVADGMHYIRMADGAEELYLLNSDPEERSNLAGYAFAAEPLQRFRASLRAMLKKQ